jgi:hypothetical protein
MERGLGGEVEKVRLNAIMTPFFSKNPPIWHIIPMNFLPEQFLTKF